LALATVNICFLATGLQDAILSAMEGAFGARKQILTVARAKNCRPFHERYQKKKPSISLASTFKHHFNANDSDLKIP
jgi:hypothetical protein